MDLIGGAQRRSMEDGNINRTGGTKARAALLTPRSASVQMDEALMRLEIFEEKATLLVINDLEEEGDLKWLLAVKVLHRTLLHVQTIFIVLRLA